jgi:hypothetical protein
LDERLIEGYLDRLRRELELPPEQEEEILREVRSHLLLSAQDLARRPAGSPALALERFGPAREIGGELRRVHGRATWREALLAVLPLLLLGIAASVPQAPAWLAAALVSGPVVGLAVWVGAGSGSWPLWGWTWLGSLPLVVPNAPFDPLWGALAYLVVLLLVRNRNWLEATLALYPLPTIWAFHRTALVSRELYFVGWGTAVTTGLGLGMAAAWTGLLVRLLRTPSGRRRIARALEGQGLIFVLNTLTVVVARLWPTYPAPYSFSWRYLLLVTLPYGLYHGLPYLLFTVLTALPAISTLVRPSGRRGPPSRPAWSG